MEDCQVILAQFINEVVIFIVEKKKNMTSWRYHITVILKRERMRIINSGREVRCYIQCGETQGQVSPVWSQLVSFSTASGSISGSCMGMGALKAGATWGKLTRFHQRLRTSQIISSAGTI